MASAAGASNGLKQVIPLAFRTLPKRKKPIDLIKKWHIVRGDKVEIIQGAHKGKQGVVQEVLRKKNAVLIENVNMRQRKVRSTPMAPGRMFMAPGPIHYSNVNLVDPVSGKPTRISRQYLEDGTPVRIAKRSGAIIPKPEILKERRNPRPTETGPMDTPPELVIERTASDLELTHEHTFKPRF